MPFIRVDAEMYDEIASELGDELPPEALGAGPSWGFEYEAAETQFHAEKLGERSQVVLALLREAGAEALDVHYDGGHDEGFSRPDTVRFADGTLSGVDAVRRITTPAGAARIRTAHDFGQRPRLNAYYANQPDEGVFSRAIDELANEFAILLLGRGYGTGEYSLYGRFTADLATGRITDHADAAKPDTMME